MISLNRAVIINSIIASRIIIVFAVVLLPPFQHVQMHVECYLRNLRGSLFFMYMFTKFFHPTHYEENAMNSIQSLSMINITSYCFRGSSQRAPNFHIFTLG